MHNPRIVIAFSNKTLQLLPNIAAAAKRFLLNESITSLEMKRHE